MGACTERISAKAAREGQQEVSRVAGAARKGKGVIELAATVYGAEDETTMYTYFEQMRTSSSFGAQPLPLPPLPPPPPSHSPHDYTSNGSEDISDTDANQCS